MPFESEAQRAFMYANHPKIAQRFENETPEDSELPERVQNMADGGYVNDFTFKKDDLFGPPPPFFPQTPPPTAPAPGPAFNPNAGLPPVAKPPAPTPPVAPPPDELNPFLSQMRSGLDKYGPEQQMAVEQEIQKRRGGFAQTAGNAMTGFADALMQGVARAGSGNFQQNLQNRNEKTEAGIRNAMKEAQAGKQAQVKQEMELAQIDPNSPLSKMAQRAYGSSLKGMPGGQDLTDAQISLIPASTIADILSKKVDLAKAIAEVESTQAYRDATLGVQRESAAEAARHAKAEEGIAKTGQQTEANKILANRSGTRRFVDWATQNPAVESLKGVAGGFEPDVMDYARTHGISPEAAQIQKERWLQKNQPGGAQ